MVKVLRSAEMVAAAAPAPCGGRDVLDITKLGVVYPEAPAPSGGETTPLFTTEKSGSFQIRLSSWQAPVCHARTRPGAGLVLPNVSTWPCSILCQSPGRRGSWLGAASAAGQRRARRC